MRTDIHHPTVTSVETLSVDMPGREFHLIRFTDKAGGALDMFIDGDWKHWDAITAAIDAYRSDQ